MNKETHFLDAFEHVLNRSVKHAPDLRQILACVVAYGTNMGLGEMAEVCGLSHASLITTARSYLSNVPTQLITRFKDVTANGSILELVIWKVPKPLPPTDHGYKYSAVYVAYRRLRQRARQG